MLLLICFAVAYAIVEGSKQLGSDTRSRIAEGRAVIAERTAKYKAENGWKRPGRWALAAGEGLWLTGRTSYRAARFSGISAWTGAKRGWQIGKEKARQRQERRAR